MNQPPDPEDLPPLKGEPIIPKCVHRNGIWGPYIGRSRFNPPKKVPKWAKGLF